MLMHQIPPTDTNRYVILHGRDGVYETVWATAQTLGIAKHEVAHLIRKRRAKFEDLAIADRLDDGRLVSFVL